MSKRSGCKKLLGAAVALGLSVLATGQARAGFTSIGAPWPGEKDQAQILSNALGGTFTASGLNYTNGTITATRIDDSADQTFSFDIKSVDVLGVFAAQSQQLGYTTNNGVTIHNILDASGKGFAATGSSGAIDMPASYEFVRYGDGSKFFSAPTDNPDGTDHMVTYLISGKSVKNVTYVMFWEDLTAKQGGDFDYNDLSVKVVSTTPASVPLPAAAWSGMTTLLGGALVAGVRKARRQMA